MEKLDKETQKIYTRGEHLEALVKGEGWQIARELLFDRLQQMDSIRGLDGKKPKEELLEEIKAKTMAQDLIIAWFKDIDGEVAQYRNRPQIKVTEQTIIRHFDSNIHS